MAIEQRGGRRMPQQRTPEHRGPELSAHQQSRLRSFGWLVANADFQQANINKGEQWEMRIRDEQGKQVSAVPITQKTVDTMKQTVFHVYEGFANNLIMKAAADKFLAEGRQLREQGTSPKKLNTIWEAGKDDI